MNLLLDTHVFLWWDENNAKLPTALKAAIANPENRVYVSAVSAWEIAIKQASGKLLFAGSAAKAISEHRFLPLSITVEHAEFAGSLPQIHRDPFDRLLVSQARLESLWLVTVDEEILRYEVSHI